MKQSLKRWLLTAGLAVLCVGTLAACSEEGTTTQAPVGPSGTQGVHSHAFGQWQTVKEATCTADGEQQRKCECGETESETIAALGHDMGDYVSDGNATCLADGTQSMRCSRCDERNTRAESGSALGHDFGDYISDNNATCTADGTMSSKCSRCEATMTRTQSGSALGHDFRNYVSDGNATCTVNGTQSAMCSRCEKKDIRLEEGSAKGHDYNSSGVCKVCGAKGIPCTGIELVDSSQKTLTFTARTESVQLKVKLLPENTTEQWAVTYKSGNEAVVTVDKNGVVRPAGEGTTLITVSCGDHSVAINVSCSFSSETKLELKKNDITLSPNNGISFDLYALIKNNDFDRTKLVCTSEDTSVVRIEGTTVIAVSNNIKGVLVTMTYEGQSVTCRVRVSGIEEIYELSTGWTTGAPSISVSAKLNETFELKLVSKDTGEIVQGVKWTVSNDFSKCCTMEQKDGVLHITAKASTSGYTGGYVYVETTYAGITYRCRIIVGSTAMEQYEAGSTATCCLLFIGRNLTVKMNINERIFNNNTKAPQ